MKETGTKLQRPYVRVEMALKRKLVREYLQGGKSYQQLGSLYGIPGSNIQRWVQKFSSDLAMTSMIAPMTEEEQKELEALKAHNAALKQQLEQEQMKNFALETMIDLAKDRFGVDLRKNSGAKQSEQ